MLLLISIHAHSQELYVYTEPASNMAAKSMGFRLTNNFMRQAGTSQYKYMLAPEAMVSISKELMLHGEVFLSNRNDDFKFNGASLYLKYRFLSNDEVHSHFRMAAYMRGSFANTPVPQPAIDLLGMNTGVETGLVATSLQNRVAVSAGLSHLYAADNSHGNKFIYGNSNRHAIAYTLSIGKLMLPKEYNSYDQTNMNLMLEVPGQTNLAAGKTFVDLAPSVQFIIKSRMRFDLGYRFALLKDLRRTSNDGALVRFEYNIFNAF
jgi:hypothetical protein